MRSGGTLTITTDSANESHVAVTLQDTGCGMTPEQQQRVFEPFFTTKEKGVGLGMSIAHRLIEALHGAAAAPYPVGGVKDTSSFRSPKTLARFHIFRLTKRPALIKVNPVNFTNAER